MYSHNPFCSIYKESSRDQSVTVLSTSAALHSNLVSCPDHTQLTQGETVGCQKSKSLGWQKYWSLVIANFSVWIMNFIRSLEQYNWSTYSRLPHYSNKRCSALWLLHTSGAIYRPRILTCDTRPLFLAWAGHETNILPTKVVEGASDAPLWSLA